MNITETTTLLATVQVFDNREIGGATVAAWQATIGDLPLDIAVEAVTAHYRHSTDWLMPAHVRAIATTIHRERCEHARNDAVRAELAGYPTDPVTAERIAELRAEFGFPRDLDDPR